MITDAELTSTGKSVPTNTTGISDVFDLGPKVGQHTNKLPKGAKVIVELSAALQNASSAVKLLYASALNSGGTAIDTTMLGTTYRVHPVQYAGASGSTAKRLVFPLDSLDGVDFRYLQVQLTVNTAESAAVVMSARLVLDTPNNSGAVI